MTKTGLFAAASLMLLPAGAHADTIYRNPIGSGLTYGWTSSSIGGEPGFVTYDDFTLDAAKASTYTVTGATWSGYFYNSTTDTYLPRQAVPQVFELAVFQSDGNAPKASNAGLDGAIATRYLVATESFTHSFSASFAGFTLDAGKNYWLSLYAINPVAGDLWTWAGVGTSGNSVQFGEDGLTVLAANQVFSLAGSVASPAVTGSVPEPGTWATMMIGLGLVGAGLRRQRRRTVRVTYG